MAGSLAQYRRLIAGDGRQPKHHLIHEAGGFRRHPQGDPPAHVEPGYDRLRAPVIGTSRTHLPTPVPPCTPHNRDCMRASPRVIGSLGSGRADEAHELANLPCQLIGRRPLGGIADERTANPDSGDA